MKNSSAHKWIGIQPLKKKKSRVFPCFGILSTLLVFRCTSLPNEKIGAIDHRQLEYSLIRNNNGSAIVVFENGLNGKMNCWNKIIPEISKEASTFAYNRPGYGSSDPVSTPRDGLPIIDELRLFLKSNGWPWYSQRKTRIGYRSYS